jgi:hypothetical protein
VNSIYLLARYDDSGETIEEIISAHPTQQIAIDAQRFYRKYTCTKSDAVTAIIEVDFLAS